MLKQLLIILVIALASAADSRCVYPGQCTAPVTDFSLVLNVRPR